jgi:uncharacterized protein (DUF1800 family)
MHMLGVVRYFSTVFAIAAVLGAGPLAQGRNAAVPRNPDNKTIVHVLNRLGFGPTPAAVDRVRQIGLPAYLDEQLHPERIADTAMAARLAGFTTLTRSSADLAAEYFLPAMQQRRDQQRRAAQTGTNEPGRPEPGTPPQRTPEQMELARMQRAVIGELSQQKILRAVYSERQLEEVMVDFWFNHFNVFVGKGQVRLYLTEYERDAIRPHVLGKFRGLLAATAESPAMLFYLDNWQSTAPPDAQTSADRSRDRRAVRRGRIDPRMTDDLRRRRQRERVDQDGMAQPGRTLADLPPQMRRRGLNENYARELMELHTLGVDGGYTQKDVQEVARAFTGWTISNPRQGGSFRFDPRMHDDGEKFVLGHRIPAGGELKDGERVLDILAKHPSTARFIATKLVRRFVADNPPQALVARAAERFTSSGGDIREVVRTIVTSPEFFASEAYRAKTKSPFEFVASALRTTGTDVANAMPVVQSLREQGMPLYGAQPPTGYADKAEAWVNSGALLNRMNFAVALTSGQMRALRAPWRSTTADDARRTLLSTALADDVTESTAAIVTKASTAPQAIALILGSPEFQKR